MAVMLGGCLEIFPHAKLSKARCCRMNKDFRAHVQFAVSGGGTITGLVAQTAFLVKPSQVDSNGPRIKSFPPKKR